MSGDNIVDRLVELAIQAQSAFYESQGREPEANMQTESLPSPSTTASTSQLPASYTQLMSLPNGSITIGLDDARKHVFKDSKSAALFLLLLEQTSIPDFVAWVTQEQNSILQAPTRVCKEDTWKYLLLQDPGLEKSLPVFLSTTTTSASATTSSSDPTLQERSTSPAVTERFSDQENWPMGTGPSTFVTKNSHTTGNLQTRKSAETAINARSPRKACVQPKAKRARTLSQLPDARHDDQGQSRASNSRARGSTRRVPELEGIIVCPDCRRKGQSIFDPNNSTADGVVWQYFYCRNGDCTRGRSSSRYIGWTTRKKVP